MTISYATGRVQCPARGVLRYLPTFRYFPGTEREIRSLQDYSTFMKRNIIWLLGAVLTLCCPAPLMSCSNSTATAEQDDAEFFADRVWEYSKTQPDGFTIDLRTMKEPTGGIVVAYAATQGSHTRADLHYVVAHALVHKGIVGGWLDSADGTYYFDSNNIFPENQLKAAIGFAKDNHQRCAYILSTHTEIPTDGSVAAIVERDTLRIGTTGDYRPLSFREADGSYWGFGIEVAEEIARSLGVATLFVPTSWPTLTADVMSATPTFDFAIGGITITDARREAMLMSEGYLANGKTILCRAEEAARFGSLADVDKADVRVMVNPGGLNEKFANENLHHATIIVHPRNEEIPALVASGEADVMITEITEAPYYVQTDPRLAAPLLAQPFTHGQIGVLMRKGQDDLLDMVNNTIRAMKADGTLRRLHEKYGLIYAY